MVRYRGEGWVGPIKRGRVDVVNGDRERVALGVRRVRRQILNIRDVWVSSFVSRHVKCDIYATQGCVETICIKYFWDTSDRGVGAFGMSIVVFPILSHTIHGTF
jgi:hypothetical protein